MNEKSADETSPKKNYSSPAWSVRALVSVLVALAYRRYGKWIATLEDEKRRLAWAALLAVCAAFFLAGSVFFLSVGVILFFWDTHRLDAIGGVILFYLFSAGFALWRLRCTLKRKLR